MANTESNIMVQRWVMTGGSSGKLAYYLTPLISEGKPLPLHPSRLLSYPELIGNRLVEVSFKGWKDPPVNWEAWVSRMHDIYGMLWRTIGIYHAVMNSTCTIYRDDNLVLAFGQRWCPKTKSFVFPWGEATLTLEDMMILGGFSIVGDPISHPLQTDEDARTLKELNEASLALGSSMQATHALWIANFMDKESAIEHAAFLALWLSRFVFTSAEEIMKPDVFPIAIHLAKGRKMALAPTVLATLYRDLAALRKTIDKNTHGLLQVSMFAPFQYVQVWVWERFPTLRPQPDFVETGEPRLARWNKRRTKHLLNINLNSITEENFWWRPYIKAENNPVSRWSAYNDTEFKGSFYNNRETVWRLVVATRSGFGEEVDSFIRCIRVSMLIGLQNSRGEQYLPHRVARQFGFDQDVPADIPLRVVLEDPKTAWAFYIRHITDRDLYMPPKLCKLEVTERYKNWWLGEWFAHTLFGNVPKTCRLLEVRDGFVEIDGQDHEAVEDDEEEPLVR